MQSLVAKLILGCLLVLGGSDVLGQGSNPLFPPPIQYEGSDPRPSSRPFAAAAGPWDDGFIDVEVRENLVYCGMGDGSLMILDIIDPTEPKFVSRIYFQDEIVRDMKLRGDFVYFCAGIGETGIFRIIDISDPATPIEAGSHPRPGARGLDIVGSLAFVANGEATNAIDGMYILDINDPGNIALVDSVATSNGPYKVRVRGDYAHVTGFGSLCTIDVSDPLEATVVSQFSPDIDHMPWELDMKEDDSLIYVADLSSIWPAYWSAFSVYNVAAPKNPSLWGRYPLIAYVADVKLKGDIAYVSNGSCGLQVFDITDPTAPDSVGRYLTPSNWVDNVQSFAGRMAIEGDLLILADIGPGMIGAEAFSCYPTVPEPGDPSPGDLVILDISEPTTPTVIGFYTPSEPTGINGNDDPDKLPGTFALHQNYPNPFNPNTSIAFDLPQRSEVVLTIYNLLGRVVSRQAQTMSAGYHALELDMTDQSSGVYLYKLQTTDFVKTKKMLLLK